MIEVTGGGDAGHAMGQRLGGTGTGKRQSEAGLARPRLAFGIAGRSRGDSGFQLLGAEEDFGVWEGNPAEFHSARTADGGRPYMVPSLHGSVLHGSAPTFQGRREWVLLRGRASAVNM